MTPNLSQLLADARKRAGLTQNQLAQRLQTHPTSVSAIERGVTGPSVATIERWLDACGFTLRVVPADRLDVVDALDSAPPETVALVRRMLRSLPEKLEEAERMLLAMLDRRAGGGS